MKTLFSVFALLALTSNANAVDISCTNATGSLVYSYFSYSGGPAPGHGMVSSEEKWTYNSQLVFKQVERFGCYGQQGEEEMCPPGENIIDPDLTTQFIEGTEKILWESNPSEPWMTAKKYVIQAEIFRPSGNPLPGQAVARFDDFMICYYESVLRP